MIANDNQLREVAERINNDLQSIQDYLGSRNSEDGRIRFPYGHIQHAQYFRGQLWFLNDEILCTNCAYTCITIDVFRWIINRTKITGIAKEMIIKQVIFLFASLCESITKDVRIPNIGKGLDFKKRIAKYVSQGIIISAVQSELNWLWDSRNNIHLFLVRQKECGKYTVNDANRAKRAYIELCNKLDQYIRNGLC